MKQKVKISACLITYNQEDYIKQCIEGALSQKLDFCYEIVIGDDCSTDGTSEICQSYQRRFPDLIKYRKRDKNIGMIRNWIKTISDCSGDYLAICEGDDYWTDPLKLQKQVDFLEANPDYNICFHEVAVFNQSKNARVPNTITRRVPETTDVNDLAKGNFIHTPSVLIRNNFNIPKWFKKSPIGDWSLYMLAVKDKKIKKIEEVMAVYRVHGSSIWSSKPQETRILDTILSFELLAQSDQVNSKVRAILETKILDYKQILQKKDSVLTHLFKRIKLLF